MPCVSGGFFVGKWDRFLTCLIQAEQVENLFHFLHFANKPSTAEVIAFTPVSIVGSGMGLK